jgi:hypothetical protein
LLPGAQRDLSEVLVDSQTGRRKEVLVQVKTFYVVTAELQVPTVDGQPTLPLGAHSFSTLPTAKPTANRPEVTR